MEELLAVVACFGCSHMVVILERSILFHLNDIISFITNNNYEHIYLILSAGKKTFQHVKEYVEDIVLVTDEEIKRLANLSV